MTALEPAAAVAVGICLIARRQSERAVTRRHPAQGCDWCSWPTPELAALLDDFDREGYDARVFAALRPEHQRAMVTAAQAIPEPGVASAGTVAVEPGWFDLPDGAGS